jgi:Xaa-Pro dipeptidase
MVPLADGPTGGSEVPNNTFEGLPAPITSPPSREELAGRLTNVQARMHSAELDFYVSFNPVNIYYLTNFANYVHERPFLLVIPCEGVPVMVAPLLETSHVRARARCDLEYATYFEYPAPLGHNWFDVYGALFKDASSRVGVESALPIGIVERTPGTRVVVDIIDDVRLVKTAYEIGRNVHACQIVTLGHEKLLEICRPGVAEGAIYSSVSQLMMGRILADIPDANTMVCSAKGTVWPPSISHDPHRIPTLSMPMEQGGPHVSIVVAQVDGYGVELERTFFLGTVPDWADEPFNAMLEARALAFELARPGAVLSEIDFAVRELIARHGYGDRILHRTGHGMGITGHEAPYVALGDDRELEPDMLISIEPGIYFPDQGGFRHSDTVLITDSACVSLTQAPDQLEDLTLPA